MITENKKLNQIGENSLSQILRNTRNLNIGYNFFDSGFILDLQRYEVNFYAWNLPPYLEKLCERSISIKS